MIDVNVANEIVSSIAEFDGDNEEETSNSAELILVEPLSANDRSKTFLGCMFKSVNLEIPQRRSRNANVHCAKDGILTKPMRQVGNSICNRHMG